MCTACNDARIEAKNGIFRAVGAPTEAALVVLAEKLGLADEAEQRAAEKERSADELGNPDAVSRQYAARSALFTVNACFADCAFCNSLSRLASSLLDGCGPSKAIN